ncbi:hypothetical protein [Lachnoclostridium phytofermentans]|uniref:Uncharacterized protein n=1 Tax=Lachnoclostridium phytofermentans (strain ATCC 700394 / DSM 18823 / ISDg) TaxID=357809 RepID=A9KRC7_LACP7|nr:hypothetical protein [Lachnoclostridium phytofermentans]ABX42001.1 hypothetical protein Cphy_1629 [Lachnoclostridium phytofermentans ISDg]
MHKLRDYISVLIVLIILFAFTGCKQKDFTADYTTYYNMKDAVRSSNLIIKGQIKNVERNKSIVIGQSSGMSQKYAVSDVEILDVIYGEANIGDTIQIKQMENEKTTKEAGYLEKDQIVILLLQTYASTPASLINPAQGKMVFIDNILTVTMEDDLYRILSNSNQDNQESTTTNISNTPITYPYETVISIIKGSIES